MFEDLLNALKNFGQNRVRTFLSLLGIIIGVGSVIIITTLGYSATQSVTSTFGDSGLDQLQISEGFMSRQGQSAYDLSFDEDFREDLWDNIDGLDTIYYVNNVSSTLRLTEGSEASVTVSGIEHNYLESAGAELMEGEWFSVSDDYMGAQKIILGYDTADSLFPNGDGLGQKIIVDTGEYTYGFTVAGILEDKDSGMVDTSEAAYFPRGFYIKKINANPEADSILVQVLDQNETSDTEDEITDWVESFSGEEDLVSVRSMASMLEKVDETLSTISLLLASVAGISLLVGGIGIMNIMIVTVTERRKEIGIRKALGATPSAIKSQFLVEAAAITIIGGTIGIIVGIIISVIATYIMNWSFNIQWSAVLFSFAFSALVGLFFGYNPAARAARLDPVDALASE
ncbi:MAG: ABC transporter permease [Spirochaetales bacterium]|uniref:ABC transporter permease n=1 Tax=Candidatus Thalassospirochaeta sargassi TaxID=3119039 RepID=A0AAJ1II20_9SPIO|nr:ABC transporter permease [Spirochaetales bacterium]